MIQGIAVKCPPVDLRAVILTGEARDANLTACLLYLIVAGDGGALVEVEKLAAAFGVSNFTVTRWVRRLSKMGLLVVRVRGDGLISVEVQLGAGLGPVEASSLPLPPAPTASKTLTATAAGRFEAAREVLWRCPTIMRRSSARGSSLGVFLDRVVRNPLFDGLDLADELRHADAWVLRTSYTDMPKFLMNWLRKEAKKKKPLRNASAVPTGKYDAAQAAARGQ